MLDNRAIYLTRMVRAEARKQLDYLSYKSRWSSRRTQRTWKSFRTTQYREVSLCL